MLKLVCVAYTVRNGTLACIIEAEGCMYVSKNYAIIGSDNPFSPARRQAIVWTNAGLQ